MGLPASRQPTSGLATASTSNWQRQATHRPGLRCPAIVVQPRGQYDHHCKRVGQSPPSSPGVSLCPDAGGNLCPPRTRSRSIGALSRREAASCPGVRPVSSTSGTARPRCSIRPASCGRGQRPRRSRQVAASRGGPVGSGQSAAVRHQQQHEASPQHPAQWNVVHAVGSYGDCRHRHGRSARSPGRPDRRGGEAKRPLLRHRVAGTGVL